MVCSGYGSTEVILEAARCHQRFLSGDGCEQPGAQTGEMSSRSTPRGRTRALKGPRLGGTLTCELPVSSTFCLQIGKIRMHQKPGIIAPLHRRLSFVLPVFQILFSCHMKYTQVCKAGGKQQRQQHPKVRQTETRSPVLFNKAD